MTPKDPTAHETILFAEGDSQLRKFVSALLTKRGYRLLIASDGNEALQKARAYYGVIHLLLSDVETNGMTGMELAIQLQKERHETKIMLIAGLDSGVLTLNGGWQFLPKPFTDAMPNRVRHCLREQRETETCRNT